MIKLTEDEQPPKEVEVLESKPLESKPNTEMKKSSNTGMIVMIVILIVIVIGSLMLYNHYKNKDGNKPEPRA